MELFLSYALHRPQGTYIMPGNHDMRNGHIDPDSGYGVLQHIVESNHPTLMSMDRLCDCIYYGEEKIRERYYGTTKTALGYIASSFLLIVLSLLRVMLSQPEHSLIFSQIINILLWGTIIIILFMNTKDEQS